MVYLLFIVFWLDLWDYPNESRILVVILKRVYLLNFSFRYNIIFRSVTRSWKRTTFFFQIFSWKLFSTSFRHFQRDYNKNWFWLFDTQNRSDYSDGHRICISKIIIWNTSKTNFHSEFRKKMFVRLPPLPLTNETFFCFLWTKKK